jgi:hypothetical protein
LKRPFVVWALLPIVVYIQVLIWIAAFTMIVGARGEGNPSFPATVEAEEPLFFWLVILSAAACTNAIFYLWVRRCVSMAAQIDCSLTSRINDG